MMDHNSIRHKLSEYIDGAVSAAEKAEIETHLKACEKCSDALMELKKTIEHVRSIDEVEPPAWMTQKIMAKVQAGAEQQKSFSERLYSLFVVNLPVKAVAVVFLTAIALYMYRGIQPQKSFETAPGEVTARQEVSPAPGSTDERSKPGYSSSRAKQVPQAPEYKALDMKGEYEKPAPPVLADKMAPAPAPAKQNELPGIAKKEPAMERSAFAPQASAPVVDENRAVQAAGAAAKAKSQPEATAEASSPGKAMPYFRDYRVTDIYGGKHARVDLSSHPEAKTWRTQLIAAANNGSNFAGHYTIATWGCGTSCVAFGIIDAITGKVYFPKNLSRVGWAGWQGKEHGLKFRLDSNLLIVYGSPNEEEKKGIFYYIWKNNDLELIK
jgi:hypothetical protein